MRLRVFTARTSAAALAEVRAALGEDAVVLATRRVPGGVEVTAALESAEPLLIQPEPLPPPERPGTPPRRAGPMHPYTPREIPCPSAAPRWLPARCFH